MNDMRHRPLWIFALAVAIFLGCGKPQVVPVDGNTFLVSKRSAQVGFGPPEGAKRDVYATANEFCAMQGQVVETVAFNMTDSGLGRPGSVALQFRCVPPKPVYPPGSPKSRAGQLDELKSLLEKGLITQEDFEKKKQEILAAM